MRKIRILIVDDDTIIRVGLKSLIDWEGNGFLLVGEAKDGRQALALTEQRHPDIIISDIKMPDMDGIGLLEELSRRKFDGRVLVLSGYDDFSLVKRAIKLGAEDYLLKLNLDPEELMRCLREIAAKGLNQGAPSGSALATEQSRALLRQNFLRDVVSSFYTDEAQLHRSMDELGIRLDRSPVYCFALKVGELYRFEDTTAEEFHTLRFSVMNIAEEIVGSDFWAYSFAGKTGEFHVLACSREEHPEEQCDGLARKAAVRLKSMLYEYLNISCVIGLGKGRAEIPGIQTAYRESIEALSYRFYIDHDSVITWSDRLPENRNETYSLSGVRAMLQDGLMLGDADKLALMFRQLTDDLRVLNLSREVVCSIALELFYMLQEYFERNGLPIQGVLVHSYRDYQQLVGLESLRQMLDWLHLLHGDLSAFVGREREVGHSTAVAEVQALIAARYRENLPLQQAAELVRLSPTYLSALLKKHTGCSYTELLTRCRIEQAMLLLRTTNEKVYEIGYRVGYEDKYYFNRIFKRMTGMSPGEYRNQERERESCLSSESPRV